MYRAGTSSKMKKNHEILHGFIWKLSNCWDILIAHEPASNTVYLCSNFSVSLDSSFSLALLYSPTKEYLLYLVRKCSHKTIINAPCLSDCLCKLVVTGDRVSFSLSLSFPLEKIKCLIALFNKNIKDPKISERACLPISTVLVINNVLCPIIKVQVMSNYVDHELIIFKTEAITINIHHISTAFWN